MRVHVSQPLFAWDCLEDSPGLKTIADLLASVPDAKLLATLRALRGNGRNDYPVHVLWGVELLSIALRYPTTQACLDELYRNDGLRRLIGIKSESKIPKEWNMTRFRQVLGTAPCLSLLREIFDEMVQRLGGAVDDLGRNTAGDASHLSARPSSNGGGGALPEPDGGRKEYTDEQGTVTKVVEWFGYKFHILVDSKHEVVLAWQVTSPKVGDNEVLPQLVAQARANLPDHRIKTLTYDRAADDEKVHEVLQEASIVPIIRTRSMWKDEPERMLPGHDGRSNIVYDEAGTVYCYDKTSDPPVRHQMYYTGYEKSRGTLKYRCPAAAQDWRCPHAKVCNRGKKYGKTVRVKCEIDLRRFPPTPRATKRFARLYRGRTAVERTNARLKIFWGTDDGNISGAERFHGHLASVMIVHAGMATVLAAAPRWEGTLGQTRLSTIAKALRAQWCK